MFVRRLPLIAFLLISIAVTTYFYWLSYRKPLAGIDDANIYFVYMRNLAEGHGFVWNVGGEKVEGFTSLLWTLIGAFCYRLSPQHFPFLLMALNFTVACYTVYRVMMTIRKINGTTQELIAGTDVLLLAMLVFPLGFIEWNIITLMETGLWLAFIVHPLLMMADRYLSGKNVNVPLFGLLVAALVVTRPEGLMYGLLLSGLLFLQTLFEEGWKPAFRKVWFPLIAYGVTVAALVAWRLSYFGYPLPNTYYAKVSSNLLDNMKEGVRYFFKFVYSYPHLALAIGLLVITVVCILLKIVRQRKQVQLSAPEKVQLLFSVVIFTGLLVPVITGGDHFKYSRFYQFFIPLLLICFFNFPVISQYLFRINLSNRKTALAVYGALLFALFFLPKSNWIDFGLEYRVIGNKVFEDFDIAQRGSGVAELMNRTFVEKNLRPSAGVIAAGGFAYNYKGNTVDLMGLNNVAMAHASKIKTGYRNHASFSIPVFWKLMPDIVGQFYGVEPIADTSTYFLPENLQSFRTTHRFTYDAYKGIFDTPQFKETYLPALVKLKGDALFLFAYYHRDFLPRLNRAEYDVVMLERKAPFITKGLW